MPRRVRRWPLGAIASLAITLCAPAAHALVVTPSHSVVAGTSVSNIVSTDQAPVDGVPFDTGVFVRGADALGNQAVAAASQAMLFDAARGASGLGEVSLELGPGTTGFALSELEAVFDIATRSSFSVSALFAFVGDVVFDADLRLTRLADSGSVEDFVDVFRFDAPVPAVNLTGFLDPGAYRFLVGARADQLEPGGTLAGFGRFDVDFRFAAAAPPTQGVPEPSSPALVLAALCILRWLPRGQAFSPRRAPARARVP